eukprot:CAMPEP_0174854816 /NCGR_PEP_ID=MMETSP1114-20130205/31965_1 /TAXON_ID=312471 /ORGANISM="Neobodo designis, Strain CCAP 1951/1" /LENGTH=163 /DNA_ID=CAMNT_0016089527 /DNA_START=558 /DNA_END=1050 /DNA_ORIENTATION=+
MLREGAHSTVDHGRHAVADVDAGGRRAGDGRLFQLRYEEPELSSKLRQFRAAGRVALQHTVQHAPPLLVRKADTPAAELALNGVDEENRLVLCESASSGGAEVGTQVGNRRIAVVDPGVGGCVATAPGAAAAARSDELMGGALKGERAPASSLKITSECRFGV